MALKNPNATKLELQRHALTLSREFGYDNVSVSQIASAARVTERTFFRHFATKDSAILWYIDDDEATALAPDAAERSVWSLAAEQVRWTMRGDVDTGGTANSF